MVEVIIVENWKKYNGDSDASVTSCACNLIWVNYLEQIIFKIFFEERYNKEFSELSYLLLYILLFN